MPDDAPARLVCFACGDRPAGEGLVEADGLVDVDGLVAVEREGAGGEGATVDRPGFVVVIVVFVDRFGEDAFAVRFACASGAKGPSDKMNLQCLERLPSFGKFVPYAEKNSCLAGLNSNSAHVRLVFLVNSALPVNTSI